MGTHKFEGDINVTGAIKLDGTTLVPGTKLYNHSIYIETNDGPFYIYVVCNYSQAISNIDILAGIIRTSGLKYSFLVEGLPNPIVSVAVTGPSDLKVGYIEDDSGFKITTVTWTIESMIDTVTDL